MQFKKNLAFTAQETYHANVAITTGKYETKLAKAIQRKLFNSMFGVPEQTVPQRPLQEYLDDERCVKLMLEGGHDVTNGSVLEYCRQFGESATVPLITCQLVAEADAVEVFYEDQSYDSTGFELFIAEMKIAEIAKHFTAEMACMIDSGTVAYFDCAESYIVDLDDGGKIVTFNVVPVYAIH